MENSTTIKIPKKYQDKLELVEFEGKELGYWAYTIDGYMFKDMGCHTAHEYTQKELLEMIRTIVPCSCNHCEENKLMEVK